ncbi:MAG: aldehyde ferredoxin oxidoreductase family protein [Thermoplasmata archaeon]|nr:MAG: aldehyde ferredoxin oxidoreductase family protein [Thermoplasmata archaeon]
MLNRKLGVVDLSKGKIEIQEVSESLRKALLGGRGFNSYYLWNMVPEGIDPLSPENVLIFGAGFLTGTLAPSSGRFNVSAKSPETGFLGDTNCGGFFAPELRYAGFDRLILKGKAEKPSYIYVEDGAIEIRDAQDYWGLDTLDVQKAFRKDLGQVEMAVCGVAGENLVRYACIRTGIKNAGGRTGMGCVMGSKNIKAIVAQGTIGIEIAHPEEMLKTVEELKDYIMKSKITPILGSVGTPLLYEVSNAFGGIRTKNSQLNAWSDDFNASEVEKFVEKMISCSSCFVHCRHRNTLGGEGPEYTALGLLGSNIGMEKLEDCIKMQNQVNDLGLDVSSTGTYLAWATELFEKGLIDEKVTGGIDLSFNDFETYTKLIDMISRREGFGDILAEGQWAAEKLNDPNRDYLIAVKGLPQSDPHDVRYMKAFALGIATSSRGADHLRSRPTLEIFFKLPPDVRNKIYGAEIANNPITLDTKEHVVSWSENIFATIDCLGMCKFICHGFNSPHFVDYDWMLRLINAASGWDYTDAQLRAVGPRVIDIERLFNMKHGLTKAHDTLPKKYFDDPSPLKVAKGHHIDREEFAKALDRFYEVKGWTPQGKVKDDRIAELEAIA